MNKSIGLQRIKENKNEAEVQLVCQALIKIVDEIIANPNDLSKRKINLDSDEIINKLIPYSGGMETLFEIGFEEDDEFLTLPMTVTSGYCEKVRNELFIINNSINTSCIRITNTSLEQNNDTPSTPVRQKLTTPTNNQQKNTNSLAPTISGDIFDSTPIMQQCKTTLDNNNQVAPAVQRVKKRSFGMKKNNEQFARKLQRSYDHVLLYEQAELKAKARNTMPIDHFIRNAQEKLSAYKLTNEFKNEKTPYNLDDFILLELMSWFKNDFFQWVNQPECNACQTSSNMAFKNISPPNSIENFWMAGNIEVYECRKSGCNKLTRFPRYNHPEKLLETRRGRCGEWANCFMLLLRSLDYDARYILDWTDHVWCEVYSLSQNRWLHVDPCENALDKPLIYENGWAKKLSYIIAFSHYQCIDVTWRYTKDFKEVMSRRQECNENWLVKYCNKLSIKRQLLKSRREEIQKRTVTEIVEFLTPKQVKDGEVVGRQSGSLQWRLNRGEIQLPEVKSEFSFIYQPKNMNDSFFRVKYNSVKDKYTVSNRSEENQIKSWKEGASKYKNIQYKIENDWKMVYLARTTGSSSAFIEWTFDLSSLAVDKSRFVKEINLRFQSSTFETGDIKWFFYWSNKSKAFVDNQRMLLNSNSNLNMDNGCYKFEENTDKQRGDHNWMLKTENPNDFVVFKIRVDLKDGKGQNSWQHTQLFRQSLNDDNDLLDVSFRF